MNQIHRSSWLLKTRHGGRRELPVARWTALAFLFLALSAALVRLARDPRQALPPDLPIPAEEFARLSREFSEPEGFFRSDNFVSNETSYLHVVPLLKKHGISGGVYLGVGPEQNFTYIAKVRPELAFILDIRRQAVLQHLVYKAIFQMADSRSEFLAILLSRPLDDMESSKAAVSLPEMMAYFAARPPDSDYFQQNLFRIVDFIQSDCHIPLSDTDLWGVHHVFSAFRDGGLEIRYRVGRGYSPGTATPSYWNDMFPSLREILTATDLDGRMDGFLASDADFQFVKEMHRRNRIIPVVGDFAGSKALKAIAGYLDENNLQVSAFYVSNVEQYLFQYNSFELFVENVRALPWADNGVFIRSVAGRRYQHPANIPGHRLTSLLQRSRAFLLGCDNGEFRTYWELVTSDYLAAKSSSSLQD